LSSLYAKDCLAAIANISRYDSCIAYEDIAAAKPMQLGDAIQFLTTQNIDVMFPPPSGN